MMDMNIFDKNCVNSLEHRKSHTTIVRLRILDMNDMQNMKDMMSRDYRTLIIFIFYFFSPGIDDYKHLTNFLKPV